MSQSSISGTIKQLDGKTLVFKTHDGSTIHLNTQELIQKLGFKEKASSLVNRTLTLDITFGTRGVVSVKEANILLH